MTFCTNWAWRYGTRAMAAPSRCPHPACRRRGSRPAASTAATVERGGAARTLAYTHEHPARVRALRERGQFTSGGDHKSCHPSLHLRAEARARKKERSTKS